MNALVVIRTRGKPEERHEITFDDSFLSPKRVKGQVAWHWLHAEALANLLTLERLEKEFRPMIPSYGCSCLKEFDQLLELLPFREEDQFNWTVDLHNAVNRNPKLNKPLFSYEEAFAFWSSQLADSSVLR